MVLMYEEEELYSGLEGGEGSVTRLMDTQYRISYRLTMRGGGSVSLWDQYRTALQHQRHYNYSLQFAI